MSFLDKLFALLRRSAEELYAKLAIFVGTVGPALERSLQRIATGFVDFFWEIADYLSEKTERPLIEWKQKTGADLYREMIEAGADEEAAKDMAAEFVDTTLLNAPLTFVMTWALLLILPLKRRMTALSPWLHYWANRKYRATLHSPADSILIHRRNEAETRPGLKLDFDLLRELGNQGYSPDRITGILAASYNPIPWPDVLRLHASELMSDELFERFAAWHNIDDVSLEQVQHWEHRPLDVSVLFPLYWRGFLDEETLPAELAYMGYTPGQVKILTELTELIPGPQDLVRMAVREVFTPEIAEAFGQYQDLPQPYVNYMAEQGFNEEWSSRFWAAHWDLPSIGQGFEMLHRGAIDDGQLDFLLRALDVMPNWREPLKLIAYQPLTRVDVRRMHKTGVLNIDEVKRAYLDLGYNDLNADRMTVFTADYNAEEDKELSKSEVLGAYKSRVINMEDAGTMLLELGYQPEDAAILIIGVDLARQTAAKSTKTAHVRKLFIARVIDEDAAVIRLAAIPTDGNEAVDLVGIWHDERMLAEAAVLTADTLPSISDLTKFIQAGVIGKLAWAEIMRLRKYAPHFIDLYWDSLPTEIRTKGTEYDGNDAELPD